MVECNILAFRRVHVCFLFSRDLLLLDCILQLRISEERFDVARRSFHTCNRVTLFCQPTHIRRLAAKRHKNM